MEDLNGRIAIVTGAARGIGAAIARALAEAGAKVLVTDVNDGSEIASEIGGAYVHHDVTSEDEWAAAISKAKDEFGGLDILVNNAGVFWLKPVTATSLDEFRKMQQINVDGVFLGLKHAIPAIAERAGKWDGGGAIVNVSSVAGIIGSAMTTAYSASKGAVRLMTKSAAIECGAMKLNVRVNSVHPGIIDTPMMASAIDAARRGDETDDDVRNRFAKQHPLGRVGRPTDIANAVRFLASDSAAFMTGAELVVDGGMTAN